jgi:hypothetical protein
MRFGKSRWSFIDSSYKDTDLRLLTLKHRKQAKMVKALSEADNRCGPGCVNALPTGFAFVFSSWLLLALACKGRALAGGYAVDDYMMSADADVAALVFGEGRYLLAALFSVFQKSGINIVDLGPLAVVSVLILHVATIGSILRFLSFKMPYKYMLGPGALMLAHPYTAEIYTFRMAMPAFAVALLSIIISLEIVKKYAGPRSTIMAACAIVCGLLTYQIVLNYLAVVLIFSFTIALFTNCASQQEARSRNHMRRTARLISALLIAVFAYVLIIYTVSAVFGIKADERATLISFSAVSDRFHRICDSLTIVYMRHEPIFPRWMKFTQLILLIVSWGTFVAKRSLKKEKKVLSFYIACLSVIGPCLVLLSLGVIVFFKGWWPVPRVISHVSVIIGLSYYLTLYGAFVDGATTDRIDTLLQRLSWLLTIAFIGVNLSIFADQQRINSWDKALGDRIISRLETLPGIKSVEAVHFVGGHNAFPLGIRFSQGDLNISAWGPSWAQRYVVNSISGYNWRKASGEEEQAAKNYCRLSEPWPLPNSVVILRDLAIVCLSSNS